MERKWVREMYDFLLQPVKSPLELLVRCRNMTLQLVWVTLWITEPTPCSHHLDGVSSMFQFFSDVGVGVCLEEYRLVGHGRHLDQGLLTRLSAGHHLETCPPNYSACVFCELVCPSRDGRCLLGGIRIVRRAPLVPDEAREKL